MHVTLKEFASFKNIPPTSQNWQHKDVYRKVMNNQHQVCIAGANYNLGIYDVHFKLAVATE